MMQSVVTEARRLLALLPADRDAWPPLRWVIRPSTFDALRNELEQNDLLCTEIAKGPPTFLGLPYDFGYPDGQALIALMVAPDACAPDAD